MLTLRLLRHADAATLLCRFDYDATMPLRSCCAIGAFQRLLTCRYAAAYAVNMLPHDGIIAIAIAYLRRHTPPISIIFRFDV